MPSRSLLRRFLRIWLSDQGELASVKVPGTDVLQLFYRGRDNGVYSRWRTPDGSLLGRWSDEQSLGGVLNGDPTAAVIPG